jgi:hypothetical protein
MTQPSDPNFWSGMTLEALTDYVNNLSISSGSGQYVFYTDIDWQQTSPALSNAGFTMIDGSGALLRVDPSG